MFVENVGQFDSQARFQARLGAATLWLTDSALWVTLQPQRAQVGAHGLRVPGGAGTPLGVNIKISFAGASAHPTLRPEGRVDSQISYFRGRDPARWHSAVPVWERVDYLALYPGVNLQVRGDQEGQPSLVIYPSAGTHPEAGDLSGAARKPALDQVRLRVEGAQVAGLETGALRLATAAGEYRLPVAVLDAAGRAEPLHAEQVIADRTAAPSVSRVVSMTPADSASDLPAPRHAQDLIYSTFLGGTEWTNFIRAVALDSTGGVYLAGMTWCSDFPTTPGAYDTTFNGALDLFMAKMVLNVQPQVLLPIIR